MNRKRSARPDWGASTGPPRKKGPTPSPFPALIQSLPLMVASRICNFLNADSQDEFYRVCQAGKKATEHFWKAKRRMSLSPAQMAPLFPQFRHTEKFRSLFDIRFELLTLAGWMPEDRLKEMDFGGVEIIDWALFQAIIDDEFGDGKTAALMSKVTTLRLDGCTVSSDDLRNAAAVLPMVEMVSLSERKVHVYEEEMERGETVRGETKGKTTEKRTRVARLLKECFPKLQTVCFT